MGFPCCFWDILDLHTQGFLKPPLVSVVPCSVDLKGKSDCEKQGWELQTCFLWLTRILAKEAIS